jgi:A/G-specific adenine glycosylase
VASFAFEQDVAFMDTNIRRVAQRVFVGPEEGGAAAEATLLKLAAQAVPEAQGWAWNQAIMELGALICTATSPACWRCPLQQHCRAYNSRRAHDEQLFTAMSQPALPQRKRRVVAERREAPYAGSTRYYRGRIVDALRTLSHGESVALELLGPQVKPDYHAADYPWLRNLAERLASDGLIAFDGERAMLPH